MIPCWAAGLISLLMLVSAHPTQQPSVTSQQPSAVSQQPSAADQQPSAASQQPSAASQQPSAADQLSALLGPVVEGAVSRAQAGWQLALLAGRLERLQGGAEAGQRAQAELVRQQVRLDTVVHDMAALQLAVLAGGGRGATTVPGRVCRSSQTDQEPEQGQEQQPEKEQVQQQEQEQACEVQPAASHQEPAVRACARSCLQLRDQGGVQQDGVYWLTGLPVPALCDFSHDGGGWTLLLTAVSQQGWDPLSVLGHNEHTPSLTDNYSILRYADAIRDLGTGSRFAYRIEAQAEKGRQRWGGIWFAPRSYSFVAEKANQTGVSLARRFDIWVYKNEGVKQRMPWINTGGAHAMLPVLTTTSPTDNNWWGTLVTHHLYTSYETSPWIRPEAPPSGTVLYWMRENVL